MNQQNQTAMKKKTYEKPRIEVLEFVSEGVMAGTIMLALYYGMLPVLATVVIPSFLHAYLDLFSGAIQAYVFCMLSMTFIYQKMPE